MVRWAEVSWGELDAGGGVFELGCIERRLLSGIQSSQALSQMIKTVNWGAEGKELGCWGKGCLEGQLHGPGESLGCGRAESRPGG